MHRKGKKRLMALRLIALCSGVLSIGTPNMVAPVNPVKSVANTIVYSYGCICLYLENFPFSLLSFEN